MQLIKTILQFIHALWTFLMFFLFMLISAPFIIIPIILDEKRGGLIAANVMKMWAFCFSALGGIFYKTHGRDKLKTNKAYIFVVNHGSYFDGPAIVMGIPRQFRALGKKEILRMPIFGFIFRYIGVTVDRKSQESRMKSISDVKKKLQNGMHVAIFPEGTMNKTGKSLLNFYSGAFHLAIQTQTPIVPMVIHNSREVLPRGTWKLSPQTIKIDILEPIPTVSLTTEDTAKLKQQVYQIMEQHLMGRHEEID